MINLLIILAVSSVALLAAFWDYNKFRKVHRFILLCLCGVLLLGLIFQPEGWRDVDTPRYALLTEGTDIENLNINRYNTLYSIIPLEARVNNGVRIQSAELLSMYLSEGDQIDILGYGIDGKLPEDFLWQNRLKTPESGILLNFAPSEVETGKDFIISVSIHPKIDNDSLLIYKDEELWKNEEVIGDGVGTVSFSDKLNYPGPVSYRFEWMYEDSLISESWNIRAVNPERLTISVLLYSPSFEINYLVSHFAERGHSIQQRTRIGDDRFRFDAVNAPTPGRDTILEKLQQVDLLILDVREFEELISTHQTQIKDAIERGLDVLLVPPVKNQTENWQETFSNLTGDKLSLEQINRFEERSWTPLQVESTPAEIVRTTLLDINFIELPDISTILERGVGDIPVAVRIRKGSGSVSGHLFYQTYRWLLAGYSDAYNHFWSDYLSSVITREESIIDYFPIVPVVDAKTFLTSTTYDFSNEWIVRSVQNRDTVSVPVTAALGHPNNGIATFWPNYSGWHSAEYDGLNFWFYVYSDDWEFEQEYRKYVNTKDQIKKLSRREIKEYDSTTNPISDHFWLIPFLMIQIWLWVERKWDMI